MQKEIKRRMQFAGLMTLVFVGIVVPFQLVVKEPGIVHILVVSTVLVGAWIPTYRFLNRSRRIK